MANSVQEYSTAPAANTTLGSIFIGEGWAARDVNDAIRTMMSHIKAFSLTQGFITVEQFGATGVPGHNDQPSIQAAIDYADANNVPKVLFQQRAYELWCPVRTSSVATSYEASDGIPLVQHGNAALEGVPGKTRLMLKGPTGVTSRVQTVGGSAWMGGGIYYEGEDVTHINRKNLIFDGGLTYNFGDARNPDLSDKGSVMFSNLAPNVVSVIDEDVEFRNFAGEIWYMGGQYAACEVWNKNLVLDGSPQAAWNPGTLARCTCINLQAGNSYQPCETVMGEGHTYIGGRFYKGYGAFFLGTQFFDDHYYAYPNRDTSRAPTWTTFIGTQFERVSFNPGSFSRGSVTCLDAPIGIGSDSRDIFLEADVCSDTINNSPFVSFTGPPNLTTAYPSGPGYVVPPQNIKLTLRCSRTKFAKDNNSTAYAVDFGDGLYDRNSVHVYVTGEVKEIYRAANSALADYAVPLVTWSGITSLNLPGAGIADFPDGSDLTLDYVVRSAQINLFPQTTATTWAITLPTTYDYATGQRLRIYNISNDVTRVIGIAKNAAGVMLSSDCVLKRTGEYLDLCYDDDLDRWVEVGRMAQG